MSFMMKLLTFLQLRQILPQFLDHHTIISLLITAVHPNSFNKFLCVLPKFSKDSQRVADDQNQANSPDFSRFVWAPAPGSSVVNHMG